VIKGLNHLFDNEFMTAKTIFEEKADRDPLHALALSSMAFLKGKAIIKNGMYNSKR
jgi:hypothetical protein